MKRIKLKYLAITIFILMSFSGCSDSRATSGTPPVHTGESAASGESQTESAAPINPGITQAPPFHGADEQEPGQSYIDQVARDVAAKIIEPGMDEYERAKAAFDYMIASTNLIEPVGLDLWRIRGEPNQPRPSYVENRSLSVLLYGFGMCEDYAAAFTMLLRAAGLEAEYVPGLTYSSEGALVDHAWVVAKIDGVWYHLDCQLEDNISRHGAIRYRYFMKSDATMAGSHRWGQNLIDSRLLTAEQNEEIAREYIPPACPKDYPSPPRHTFTAAPLPDVAAIQTEIDAEFREYEHIHGPLEPLELDIIPPVFALEGYGPPD